MEGPLEVLVSGVERDTGAVNVYTLRRADGGPLPPFSAGAHIDVLLPGLVRQYSLLGGDRGRYEIAVSLPDNAGQASGARHLHEKVALGSRLQISAPRNHFALVEDAPYSVLIAAGIGITPLWCMAQRLAELGHAFELHYGARSRQEAALLRRIDGLSAGKVHVYYSREAGGRRLPLAEIVAAAPAGAHLYACGPAALLAAFEALPLRDGQRRHVEHFTPVHAASHEGGYQVILARSKRVIAVPKGATILEALKAANVAVSYSCTEGICGQCETRILAGQADHRDSILTEQERAEGKTMMICCSGSRGPELTLDL